RSLALSQRQSAGQSGPHSQCASGDHARAPQRTYSARVVREPALQTVPLLCNPPPIMTSKRKTLRPRAHLGTTTGSRLCPKDQPQQVRMPRVAELSENAWPRRAAAAGAPHTAAVRSHAFGGGIKMRPPPAGTTEFFRDAKAPVMHPPGRI